MSITIQYLLHKDIDKARWDICIREASNGLIYPYSVYLDAMAPGWDALVLNDYEAVFPLPWRRKWGISYLFQPFVTAQLGLFGNHLSAELFNRFLLAIPKKFRYLDLSLNHQNRFHQSLLPLFLRNNFVLNLRASYEEALAKYRPNTRRDIKRALRYGCQILRDIPIKPILELAKAHYKDFHGLHQFEGLFHQLKEQGNAVTYGVQGSNGQLLASCVFLFSHRRAYYILAGNHPNGRTLGASHLLIDAFIKDHAGTDLLLDFEGSDVRSLAFFYSSFGASEEPYAALLHNRLPPLLRWLKT